MRSTSAPPRSTGRSGQREEAAIWRRKVQFSRRLWRRPCIEQMRMTSGVPTPLDLCLTCATRVSRHAYVVRCCSRGIRLLCFACCFVSRLAFRQTLLLHLRSWTLRAREKRQKRLGWRNLNDYLGIDLMGAGRRDRKTQSWFDRRRDTRRRAHNGRSASWLGVGLRRPTLVLQIQAYRTDPIPLPLRRR